MRSKVFILGIALALPIEMMGEGSSTTQQNNKQREQLTNSDKMFLKALIQEDISEIDLAKMALRKSWDPQVKQYAQTKILEADPEMRNGAEQIAQQHGMQPPSKVNSRQKTIQDQLANKSGKVFDNAYMNYEASQQSADVKLVETELNSTSNSTLNGYVTKEKAPVVQAASAAKEISEQISSSMTHYRQPAIANKSE